MPPWSIKLTEELRSKAEARAAKAGHSSVEQYVEALVRADVKGAVVEYGAPEHLSTADDAQVEALLLRRLESTEPGVEATPEFWAKLRDEARLRSEARSGKSGTCAEAVNNLPLQQHRLP